MLTFHSVDRSGSVLSIAPEELRDLVAEIQSSGHAIVPLRTLLDEPNEPDRVALTFDDGYRSVWEEAAPVLRRAGATATTFVVAGYVGKDSRWPTQPPGSPVLPLMSWNQLRELGREGWRIDSHTVTHPDLRALSRHEIDLELRGASEAIEQHVGARPAILAYPYGYFDAAVEQVALEHYASAVTVRMGCLGPRDASHRLPRLETFYFRRRRPFGGFGSPGFAGYLKARSWLRRLRHGKTG